MFRHRRLSMFQNLLNLLSRFHCSYPVKSINLSTKENLNLRLKTWLEKASKSSKFFHIYVCFCYVLSLKHLFLISFPSTSNFRPWNYLQIKIRKIDKFSGEMWRMETEIENQSELCLFLIIKTNKPWKSMSKIFTPGEGKLHFLF